MKPTFEAYNASFKVILPNINYKEETKDAEIKENFLKKKKVIRYLEENEKITRQEVELLLNIANTRAKKIINDLLNERVILRQRTGKNIYYILIKDKTFIYWFYLSSSVQYASESGTQSDPIRLVV